MAAKVKGPWRESIEAILGAVLVALSVRATVFEAFKIPSGSMIPTLAIGDQLFVNKLRYGIRVPFTTLRLVRFAAPRRGEIVVFVNPRPPGEDFIKRIVGLPGDIVQVRDRRLYVNGTPLPRRPLGEVEPWDLATPEGPWMQLSSEAFEEEHDGRRYTVIYDRVPGPLPAADTAPVQVPPDHVFAMGDNRDHSSDSREWGTVPTDHILGRPFVRWFAWGRTGLDLSRMGDWFD